MSVSTHIRRSVLTALLCGLLGYCDASAQSPSITLEDLQGSWQTPEGEAANLSIVNGLPVLTFRGRPYQGSAFTPSGFQLVFRPQKVDDFKNPKLPTDVRQQLINMHYEQHGQVTISNPETLMVSIFLDGAQYVGETDNIKTIDARVRQAQLQLVRPVQELTIRRVELISKPPRPETQKALQDKLAASEKALEEQGHQIDEILTRKNKAITRIQNLVDATQKAIQEKEAALSALLSPHHAGQAEHKERLAKEAQLKADQAELDQTLAQLEALRPLIQPLNDRYKTENFLYWPGDLTPSEEAVYKSNKALLKRRDELWSETDKLKAEIQQLYRAEEDAIRLDKAEANYQWNNNAETLERYKAELSQLYEARRTLHNHTNQELAPLLATATEAQTLLDAAYAKRGELIKAQLSLWDEVLNNLPPLEQEVSVDVDQKVLFQYRAEKPDLEKLAQEMAAFQTQLERAHLLKQQLLELFLAENRLALEAGNKLAGDYQNGIFGNGLIMENARNQALIDWGIDVIEIVEEGIKSKSLWGSMVESIRKFVLNTSYYYMDKNLNVGDVDRNAIEAAINQAYDASLTDPMHTPQLAKLGFARVVDQVTPELFTVAADSLYAEISEMVERLKGSQVLETSNEISQHFVAKFSNPQAMKKASLSLMEGVTKDILKTKLKERYFLKESAGWQEYFQHDLNARLIFAQYTMANSAYWKALSVYNMYVRKKVEQIQQAREKSSPTLTLEANIPLKSKQTLHVKTLPKLPNTREAIRLDQVTLPPSASLVVTPGFKCLNTPCNQLILQVQAERNTPQ